MKLFDPRGASILYWRVQEDDLILYPDLVHDRLYSHISFEHLHRLREKAFPSRLEITHLFFPNTLASSSLAGNVA